MREKILTFIEKNSRIDTQELAVILGVDETAVMNELEAMEQEGIICGYHTLINWDKAGVEKVTALIEVRVTPQRGMGFDKVAERIYNYPEVNSVYLISGQDIWKSQFLIPLNLHLKYKKFFLFQGNKFPHHEYATVYQNPALRRRERLHHPSH